MGQLLLVQSQMALINNIRPTGFNDATTAECSLFGTELISLPYSVQVLIWGLYSASAQPTTCLDLWMWSMGNKPKMFRLKRFKNGCPVMDLWAMVVQSFYISLEVTKTFRLWLNCIVSDENRHVQHSYPRQNQGKFSAFYASQIKPHWRC